MTTTKKKLSLLMGTASMAVLGSFALSPIAYAQDAAPAPAAAPADDSVVVVTGQRAQLKSAQKIKKDAETVVDSITATDIGALPDRSVSEALQRVVGVTLQRTDQAHDPARLSGEGGAVFVRGLSYVSTLLNGREVFSASSGRSIGFEDVSADLMAGVDVYKATVADMVEGELGGTVNLRTRLPFDSKKRFIAFTADANYGDLSHKTFYSGSLTYSDRWSTSAGELGLLLNYSQSNVGTRSNSLSADRFDQVTGTATPTDASDDYYVPKFVGFRTIDWQQKRDAFAVAAQWRPNDALEFTLQYLDSKATPQSLEHATGVSDNILSPNSTYTYNSANQFVGGVINDAGIYNDTRSELDHKDTSDTSLSFKYHVNDKLTLSGEAQYVKSTAQIVSFTVGTYGQVTSDVLVDLTGKLPTYNFYENDYLTGTDSTDPTKGVVDPSKAIVNSALADPSSYYYQFAMDHLEDNEATDATFRLDAQYDFDSSWLKSIKTGVRFTDKDSITRENGYNWGAVSNYTGRSINADPGLDGGAYYNFADFFGGKAPQQASWFPSATMVDYYASRDAIAHTAAGLGWGWTPFNGDYGAAGYGRADNIASGVIDQTEKTSAIYGVVRFGTDNLFGSDKSWDGNIGVRAIKTELTNGTGVIANPVIDSTLTVANIDPTSSAALQQDIHDAFTISAVGGTQTGIAEKNEYTNVLPSLNLRLHWNDQLQFRFAASKAIVRPTFAQMSPFTTLGFSTTSIGNAPNQLIQSLEFTGTGGNPNLKPMEANAYDLSAEWYFAPTGSVTLALFKKDLTNYFMGTTEDESFTIGGITKSYSVFRTRNGSKGKVDGFELAYQQFYDFLPGPLSGLGLQANYTLVNNSGGANTPIGASDPDSVAGASSATLPLEGLSKNSYNVAVMYEKYGISARLAYNWRSHYLLTTSAANVKAPVWSEDYGQLDGNILYTLTPQLKIGFQATNLLQARTYLQVGYPDRLNRYNWFDTDRRFAVVLRGVF